jgi:putative aminopeptidase FrvX
MLLEKLCNATGPSGFEGEVREIIKNEIKNYVDEVALLSLDITKMVLQG